MSPRPNVLKPIVSFLFLLILVEIIACYLVWLIFGIGAVIYPATAYVLTMIVAVPVAAQQEQEDKRKWNDIEEDWKNDAAGG